MKYEVKRKPIKCPHCGEKTVATIFYGYPAFSELEDDLESGKIVLGGCCVTDHDPEWQCTSCDTKLYRHEPSWSFEGE